MPAAGPVSKRAARPAAPAPSASAGRPTAPSASNVARPLPSPATAAAPTAGRCPQNATARPPNAAGQPGKPSGCASSADSIPPFAAARPAKPASLSGWTATTAGRSTGSPGACAFGAANSPLPRVRPYAGNVAWSAAPPSGRGGIAGWPTPGPAAFASVARGALLSTGPGPAPAAVRRASPLTAAATMS